jgi:hypothetical protein
MPNCERDIPELSFLDEDQIVYEGGSILKTEEESVQPDPEQEPGYLTYVLGPEIDC